MFKFKRPTGGNIIETQDERNEWHKSPGWIKNSDDILDAVAVRPASVGLDAINTIRVQLDRGAFMRVMISERR